MKTLVKDDVRMRVFHDRKECGHLGCFVQLAIQDRENDRWMENAFVSGDDIHTTVWLLTQAAEFIDGIDICAPDLVQVND